MWDYRSFNQSINQAREKEREREIEREKRERLTFDYYCPELIPGTLLLILFTCVRHLDNINNRLKTSSHAFLFNKSFSFSLEEFYTDTFK